MVRHTSEWKRVTHGPDCTCGCHNQKDDRVKVTAHDVSVVGSVKVTANLDYHEGVRVFGEILLGISREIDRNGGIVGHIKTIVTDMNRSCVISVTDDDAPEIRDCSAPKICVECACIVMLMEPEKLRKIISGAFADYL